MPKVVSGTLPDALGTAFGRPNAAPRPIGGRLGRPKSGQELHKSVPGAPRRRSKSFRASSEDARNGVCVAKRSRKRCQIIVYVSRIPPRPIGGQTIVVRMNFSKFFRRPGFDPCEKMNPGRRNLSVARVPTSWDLWRPKKREKSKNICLRKIVNFNMLFTPETWLCLA